MNEANSTPDYVWQDAEATHAHGFIWPVLKRAIQEGVLGVKCPEAVKVFDAGCGNGLVAGRLQE